MSITCTVDEHGIHKPDFEVVLDYLKGAYRSIYGADVYLENDSQDGQLLGLFATAINDANSMAVAVYNAFSPASAQGEGLSRVVKINGIARATPSSSSVDLRVVGRPGTVISGGVVADINDIQWNLPPTVVIPPSGEVAVTATAAVLGAVRAASGSITGIRTPTLGWQSVSNPGPASEGAPVESDAGLRRRQAVSTMLPSQTVIDGIVGAVAAVDGVTRYKVYENDTSIIDAKGIPPHSIAVVVEGGDLQAVADAVMLKKTPGAGTYGAIKLTANDVYGIPHVVELSRCAEVRISARVEIKPLTGYRSIAESSIKRAISSYITALNIGSKVSNSRLYALAGLDESVNDETFEIKTIVIARDGRDYADSDINIAFDEAAICSPDDVKVDLAR